MRLIALLLLTLGTPAFAATYTVSFREFGFNRSNCAADIAVVAERFAEDSGVVVLGSGCQPPDIGDIHHTGSFTYAAGNYVATTTSDVRTSSWSFDGHYRSVEACESARSAELSVFERQTGLRAFVSYCYQANSISAPRYRVRIDAVGVAANNKRSESASWSNQPTNSNLLVEEVAAMVEASGAEIVAASVDRDISGYQVVVDYYSPEEKYLHAQEILNWSDVSACESAATELARDWAVEAVPSVFACVGSGRGPIKLLQIYQSSNILSGFDFDSDVLATDYVSRSSCVADSARIRAAIEQSGTSVFGIACGQSPGLNAWQLAVWTAR
jgi:hypothetical protein